MNKAVSATHTHTLLHSPLVIIHLRFFLGSKHDHVIRRQLRVFFTLPSEWQFSLTDGNFTRSYPGPFTLVIQLYIVPVSVLQNSWSTPHTFSQPARTQQHISYTCKVFVDAIVDDRSTPNNKAYQRCCSSDDTVHPVQNVIHPTLFAVVLRLVVHNTCALLQV